MDATFRPSQRARDASHNHTAWELMQSVRLLPKYDEVYQPEGIINLSGAINTLMTDWASEYIASLPPLQEASTTSYGSLYGSDTLLQAAAGFFNGFFKPSTPVAKSDIIAANGVTSLIDIIGWTLGDPGEGVLLLTPTFYMAAFDLSTRANLKTVPVSTSHISDLFDAGSIPDIVSALEVAVDAALCRGVRSRALFLCNPSNPQGRCYSRQTLEVLASWCSQQGLHLISDEIYALSTFTSDDNPAGPGNFCSVLSLPSEILEIGNVHCIYSLSKDFGMGGLRMGFLVTKKNVIRAAACKATWFTWVTAFSDHSATRFLQGLDSLRDYVVVYQARLLAAYENATHHLREGKIPFEAANAGLFIWIDLGKWTKLFSLPHRGEEGQHPTPERQICSWLIDRGVFLNPGEFAGSDQPGHFRLVFTGDSRSVTLGIRRIREALDELETLHVGITAVSPED